MPRTLIASASAAARLDRARAWLAGRGPSEEVLVVGASLDAAHELLRDVALERGASFGWHRTTLARLAAELAGPALAEQGIVPAGMLACEAVVARVVHALREAGTLGRYAAVAETPGLARALARSLAELRGAGVEPGPGDELPAGLDAELGAVHAGYAAELSRAGLTDRAGVLELAARAARDQETRHPWLGLPLLLLDLAVTSRGERELIVALAARAPDVLATMPAGDERAKAALAEVAQADARGRGSTRPGATAGSALGRLQERLFAEHAPDEAPLPPAGGDDSVIMLSAPGESRECVELVRRMVQLAGSGVPFDRMAVLLRSPDEYRPHLEAAFLRAGIPAHFARGVVRPDPAGRAFLALLRCAAEGLSARRFAEYLSLGEVPDAAAGGTPPASAPAGDRWVAPDEELTPAPLVAARAATRAGADAGEDGVPGEGGVEDGALPADGAASAGPGKGRDPRAAPVTAGTLRAPRRWERLLVEAAVIGGLDRWERRLDGLVRSLELDLAELEPDDPSVVRVERDLADLATLRAFALPLLADLVALPARASWGEWLERLSALATRALREPTRVLSVLAELAPMATIAGVGAGEVCRVLDRHLLELRRRPAAARYGGVYVAAIEAARGLCFDVVFVPGLAEKLFPRRIVEDPIVLDEVRATLDADLRLNDERIAQERLALRIAVGAARTGVVLSYPRLDLEKSRPRVPSFYALEAIRAAEGRLPLFEELEKRAESVAPARIGWPAPSTPELAIDAAEYDLALLDSLLERDPERTIGTARYLLGANPHLARALRFRARRWLRKWTSADGLVEPSVAARTALAAHELGARSYSPTALQHFASCPYRFFLSAIHRLAPREEVDAIEDLSPLQRGSLVHEVQFELLTALQGDGLLPVTAANLEVARLRLDAVLDAVAARHHDDLAPAIERVWEDGIAGVRADLREWLRRASLDASGFVPWRFELSFGLPERRARDAHSRADSVVLDCGIELRGSIDLVERDASGALRVTDHKTGKARLEEGAVIAGGETLQPVLYALAVERIMESRVVAGRLYYCTTAGGFTEREIPLAAEARAAAQVVAETIGGALRDGFLPAAPAEGACDWCDYRMVCGTHEEQRTARKQRAALAALERLRETP